MKSKVKVLIVDDEKDFSRPIEFWLKSKGYSTLVASDGETAIKLVKEKRPDIVFLDLRMPGMDGVETLREIRKFDEQLPVVIITAQYTDEVKFAEVEKLGSSGFFPKKGTFEELGRTIEVILRGHERLGKKK